MADARSSEREAFGRGVEVFRITMLVEVLLER